MKETDKPPYADGDVLLPDDTRLPFEIRQTLLAFPNTAWVSIVGREFYCFDAETEMIEVLWLEETRSLLQQIKGLFKLC